MFSSNRKDRRVAMVKYEKPDYSGAVRINLANNLEEVAVLLLVALQSAAKMPGKVSETEVNREIQQLLDKGDYDQLAYQGLKWLQEIGQ